jgi:signal transduction histidine kinase
VRPGQTAGVPYDPAALPLDALAADAVRGATGWTAGLRVDPGRAFLRALAEGGVATYGQAYRTAYPLSDQRPVVQPGPGPYPRFVSSDEPCPTCGAHTPAFRAMSEAVLAIAAEHGVEPVLEKLVHAARELVDARYAAIGVPDGEGGFARFITSGMTDKQWDAIGTLPRQHGLLGAMLATAEPFRTPDIQGDPRFEGWPAGHPSMRSFLGVPIVSRGEVVGAFYLTDKKGTREFDPSDQAMIETFAAHAAIALENARLLERSRELSVVEERTRLARELHDSVTQTLFSLGLTVEAAAQLAERDPERAREEIHTVRELARDALEELRSVVFELRPAELGTDGLAATLRKHVDVLRRVYKARIEVDLDGERPLAPEVEREVFRVAQEALANALKHARPTRVELRLRQPNGRIVLTVADDGVGFDQGGQAQGRHLGLVSMQERAEALGGELRIDSRPGEGTTVTLDLSRDAHPAR